jgi:hypothetical protein
VHVLNAAHISKVGVKRIYGDRDVKSAVQKSGKSLSEGDPVRGVRTSLTTLRQEINRMLDELSSNLPRLSFGRRIELEPFRPFQAALGIEPPAVDLVEKRKARSRSRPSCPAWKTVASSSS